MGGTGWWLPCCCSTFLNLTVYGLVIPLSALVIAVTVPGMVPGSPGRADRRDLTVRGVDGAALLYGLYHVGYGMGGADIVLLVGLGVVYAVVFALARNVIAIRPCSPLRIVVQQPAGRRHPPPVGLDRRLRRYRCRHGHGDLASHAPATASAAIGSADGTSP